MLRYFYVLVCIQLCFCSDYTDHPDVDIIQRRTRSKNSRFHKKVTKSPRRNRLVQFDVENFMRRPDEEAVIEYDPYSYRIKRRNHRHASEYYYGERESFIGSTDIAKPKKLIDYSNIDDNTPDINTRTPDKQAHGRHFNFHTLSFDDKNTGQSSHDPGKGVREYPKSLPISKEIQPESKCSFKAMRIPFFSYNKASTKAKNQKRRMFCFNCHKPTNNTNQLEPNPDMKADDRDTTSNDKIEKIHNRVSKRAYEHLCPKCIRDLFKSLKRKNKKIKETPAGSRPPSTPVCKETKPMIHLKETKPVLDKNEKMENNLQADYNYLNVVREKRDEIEESERERRLNELEEVEKKIDNVHVTAPTFTRLALYIQN